MNPDEATSLKQLFLSMLPKDGGIVVGTVTKESPLTIQIHLGIVIDIGKFQRFRRS